MHKDKKRTDNDLSLAPITVRVPVFPVSTSILRCKLLQSDILSKTIVQNIRKGDCINSFLNLQRALDFWSHKWRPESQGSSLPSPAPLRATSF